MPALHAGGLRRPKIDLHGRKHLYYDGLRQFWEFARRRFAAYGARLYTICLCVLLHRARSDTGARAIGGFE